MNLQDGSSVDFIGVLQSRTVIHPRTGTQPFVKTIVREEGGSLVDVVFWDAGRAPLEGERVQIEGKVRSYRGRREVHAFEWVAERTTKPTSKAERLIRFYMGCVEAEAASATRLTPGGKGHIEFVEGDNPLFLQRQVPSTDENVRWCRQRANSLGENLVVGWPMIVGNDPEGETSSLTAAPLFTIEAGIAHDGRGWNVQQVGSAIELNPFALELIGIAHEERDSLARAIEELPEVELATTSHAKAASIISALAESGIEALRGLESDLLSTYVKSPGVHNYAVLMATRGSTRITRMLLEDLEELAKNPELVEGTPAELMLGLRDVPHTDNFLPLPTVVPSTISQDMVASSAIQNPFTVVTGPPGTGKSQAIVNVVAAALANKQTVLFASKNNKAVDVVFDRLNESTAAAGVIRAGASSRRSDVATNIARILSMPGRAVDPAKAHDAWQTTSTELSKIYEHLKLRERLEADHSELRHELTAQIEALPNGVPSQVDNKALEAAAQHARDAVTAFGRSLGLFRKWEKHQARIDLASEALQSLGGLLGLDRQQYESPLQDVLNKPKRSLAPQKAFSDLQRLIDDLAKIEATQKRIQKVMKEIDDVLPRHELDDRLFKMQGQRLNCGRDLIDARWEQARRDDPASRTAAGQLSEQLSHTASTGSGGRRAKGMTRAALPSLPIWGVTNLSARTNLPLENGLFDLVVIDEASQCDVASALPLLARAKRAVVIGDRRQLTHITALASANERRIAERVGIDEQTAEEFSYRSRSCFGMASTRVREAPIFLDMHFRSHPSIIGFSNEHFYDSRLQLCSASRPPAGMPALEWVRVDGSSQKGPGGRSRQNAEEAEWLVRHIVNSSEIIGNQAFSIGVVTPYRAQADLIRQRISEELGPKVADSITTATAHRFQGDERDIIYFSPTISSDLTQRQAAFAGDANLVNVALTRARRRLVVVGSMSACLNQQSVLADFARYVSRLEAGGFDSPIEQVLFEALIERGIAVDVGRVVANHRLDLAIEQDDIRLDIECDGAPFHTDIDRDSARDRVIQGEGWKVLRFSGREINFNLDQSVEVILSAMK